MDYSLIKDLSWNAPIVSQEKAIKQITSMNNPNINILIQPLGKEYWENSAKALCVIGYPGIEKVIPDLLKWVKDMNWPGSSLVFQLLKSIPKDILIQYLELATQEALKICDEEWLINLSSFLTDLKFKEDDFISKETYRALKNAK